MKNKAQIILLVVAILLLSFPLFVFAHPGRTDSNGGHTDHSTGEYHYHHGYPAHQHIGGKCPYDYDDNTSSKDDYFSDNSYKPSNSYYEEDPLISWVIILVVALINILIILTWKIIDITDLKLPNWLGTIISLVLIGLCIGDFICFVINIVSSLISSIVVFAGYYGTKRLIEYKRKKR